MGFIKDLFSNPKAPKASAMTAANQAAQGKAIQQSQAGTLINQNVPGQSITYTPGDIDPATGLPRYSADVQYSPENQQLFNQLLQSRGGIGAGLGNLIGDIQPSLSQAPDFSMEAGSLTRGALDRHLGYMDPYFENIRSDKDTQLRNQGLVPGSHAYDRAMMEVEDNIGRNVMQAVNTFQPQAFSQSVQQYQTPINTIQQLLGMTTPVTRDTLNTPTFSAQPVDAAAHMQAQYKAELDARNQAWGGLAGIGGALFGAPGGLSGIMAGLTGGTPKI